MAKFNEPKSFEDILQTLKHRVAQQNTSQGEVDSVLVKNLLDALQTEKVKNAQLEVEIKTRFDKKYKLLKKRIEKLKTKSNNIQDKFIQTFGIFTALFTFVSIEFKFLNQRMCMTQLLAVSILLLSSLVIFVILLALIAEKNKFWSSISLVLIVCFLILGVMNYPTWENKNINCKILESTEETQKNQQMQPINIYNNPIKK